MVVVISTKFAIFKVKSLFFTSVVDKMNFFQDTDSIECKTPKRLFCKQERKANDSFFKALMEILIELDF